MKSPSWFVKIGAMWLVCGALAFLIGNDLGGRIMVAVAAVCFIVAIVQAVRNGHQEASGGDETQKARGIE